MSRRVPARSKLGRRYSAPPRAGVGPTPLDAAELTISGTATFGDVGVDDTGVLELTIAAASGDRHDATGVALSGLAAPYSVTGDSGEATLAPGATRTIEVTFSPTTEGEQGDTLIVDYDDGSGAAQATRAMTGTGVATGLAWSLFSPSLLEDGGADSTPAPYRDANDVINGDFTWNSGPGTWTIPYKLPTSGAMYMATNGCVRADPAGLVGYDAAKNLLVARMKPAIQQDDSTHYVSFGLLDDNASASGVGIGVGAQTHATGAGGWKSAVYLANNISTGSVTTAITPADAVIYGFLLFGEGLPTRSVAHNGGVAGLATLFNENTPAAVDASKFQFDFDMTADTWVVFGGGHNTSGVVSTGEWRVEYALVELVIDDGWTEITGAMLADGYTPTSDPVGVISSALTYNGAGNGFTVGVNNTGLGSNHHYPTTGAWYRVALSNLPGWRGDGTQGVQFRFVPTVEIAPVTTGNSLWVGGGLCDRDGLPTATTPSAVWATTCLYCVWYAATSYRYAAGVTASGTSESFGAGGTAGVVGDADLYGLLVPTGVVAGTYSGAQPGGLAGSLAWNTSSAGIGEELAARTAAPSITDGLYAGLLIGARSANTVVTSFSFRAYFKAVDLYPAGEF